MEEGDNTGKFAGPTAQRRVRPREQLLTYPYDGYFDSSEYPYNCSFDSSILRYLDSLFLRDLGGAGSPKGISKSSQNQKTQSPPPDADHD